MNTQPIEKRIDSGSDQLEVHSIFRTIQGEGPFTGRPAIFIRLAGCNLQCPGCDTEYTSNRRRLSVSRILTELVSFMQLEYGIELIVITGGEPFRQDIYPLVLGLIHLGFTVQVETNGTLPPSVNFHRLCSKDFSELLKCFIVCSPKTGSVNKLLLPLVCAYKYVMTAGQVDAEDGLPTLALGHSAAPRVARPHAGFNGPIYVQPYDSGALFPNSENLIACIRSVMKHNYTLQLQVHKIIGLE
jgi:organic radical activating enzyme